MGQPKINVSLVIRKFQISDKQFPPIANKQRFIDSNVIDCYTVTHVDEWKDKRILYMPTDTGNKAIKTFASQRKSPSSDMYKITTPLEEQLLMPYIYHGHSVLLVANIKEETLTLLDPYEIANDKNKVLAAFYAYTFFYKSYRFGRKVTDPFLIQLILFLRVHYRKREDTYLRIFFILQFFEK